MPGLPGSHQGCRLVARRGGGPSQRENYDDQEKEDRLVAMLTGIGDDFKSRHGAPKAHRPAPPDDKAQEDQLTAILARAMSFGQ